MEILTNIAAQDGDLGDWYYPEYGDNLEKPIDKQGSFYLVPMTGGELRSHRESNVQKTKGRRDKDLFGASQRREWALMRRVLKERVKGIRNLWGKDAQTGEREPISDIEVLLVSVDGGDPGAFDLLDELYQAITDMSKFNEGVEKKSEQPSDTSTVETRGSSNGSSTVVVGTTESLVSTNSSSVS
jgi:hypothetical protein